MIDPGDEMGQHVELGRHLGPADDRRHRMLGIAERLFERLQLGLHRPAGEGRQHVRQPLGRGMGAVGGGEGVVDVEIADCRQVARRTPDRSSPRRRGSACSRAPATPPGQRGDRRPRPPGRAIGDEGDRPAEHLAERGRDRAQRHRRDRRPWAGRNATGRGPSRPCRRARRRSARSPRSRVSSATRVPVHRHVEVGAHQHALAGNVADVVERAEHQPSRAISAAVSTIRFEKPHSLSYQLTTRTSLPSSTAVSRLSTVDEAGLPL